MTDLLARLDAAEEGSRELNEDIARHVGWKRQTHDRWRPPKEDGQFWADQELPAFSTSLDAALTLVPEGCGFVVSDADWNTARASVGWKNSPIDFGAPYQDVKAATPALALCIAALRAREAI